MKHIKVFELSEADRLKLEKGYHNGPTHNYRIRCKSILLKSSGKSASEIAEIHFYGTVIIRIFVFSIHNHYI